MPLVTVKLTRGEIKVLTRMNQEMSYDSDYDETELCQFNPGGWAIGTDRISGKVAFSLLTQTLIKKDGDCDFGDEVVRYHINEWGKKALAGEPIDVPRELLMFMRL